MKRFCKILVCFMLVFCTVFAFAACGAEKLSVTSNDTSKVSSNGGIVTIRDGYMYFINGTKENDGTGNKGNIVQSAIYRVSVDANGKIAENAAYEKVVNALVGYENGSIFAFGDYIYYTTPCNSVNKNGEVLFNKTEFKRYDLVNQKSEVVYTTTTSEEEFEFSYYKQGEGLYLLVYEAGESDTLKSIKVGEKMETIFTKEKVQSVLFAEDGGSVGGANQYAYYTLSADLFSAYPTGVRVYKVLPDGGDEHKISEGKTVSLLTVRGNKLVYSYNSSCYFAEIAAGENTLSFSTDNIVCYNTYDKIIFETDANGDIYVVVLDDTQLRLLQYKNGKNVIDRKIYLFSSKTMEMIGISGDNLIYSVSNVIYKINITTTSVKPIKISKSTIDDVEDESKLLPEIVGNYLYAFYTDSKSKVTYMYCFDLTVEEAKDSVRIGVIE